MNNSINNSINGKENEIIDIQNSTIKKLNAQLSIYKSQLKDQREKIFSCDNLIINFNSLNNTYAKLKKENEILTQKLSDKNKMINEYQKLFFESKSKILLINQLNNILQEKLNFVLDTIPNNFLQNFEVNQKFKFFDLKLQKIKEECTKKQEEFENKLLNKTLNINDDKISDSERKINELEFELSISKKLNDDYAREKEEITKKENDIFKVKNEANEEINEYKNKNKQLKEENEYLTEYFNHKGKEMKNILLSIKQGNNINIKELSQKDDIINNLMKDKEILYKENEKLNSEYILLKSLYIKKFQKLKKLVDDIEKEKEEREIDFQEKIKKLEDEISNCKIEIKKYRENENNYIKDIEELKQIVKNPGNDINLNNKYNTDLNDYRNPLFYPCDYCNCRHFLCKECQIRYINN